MQYTIKLSIIKGESTEGNKAKPLGTSMISASFDNEPTVGQIKEEARNSPNLRAYTNDEIISSKLIVKGEEVKDDNVTVPERTFINYVLTVK